VKETFKLDYQTCVSRAEAWQALGRNYTAVVKDKSRLLSQAIIFHLLDLNTVDTGIRISVYEGGSEISVEFMPTGRYTNDYLYPLDAVPIQPFRNPERMKAWDDFIDVMVPIGV
jgi:hypothetical protein